MENTRYPLRPNYVGPTEGVFACVHHDQLIEWSSDIRHRMEYVPACKPAHEQAVRAASLMYIGDCPLLAEYDRALDEYDRARTEYDRAQAEYIRARAEYIRARAECDRAWAEYDRARAECDRAWAAIDRPAVLAWVRQINPECGWDETIGQLRFPEA